MPHIEEKKPSVIREVGQWVLATLFMVAVAMMVPLTAWFIEPNLLVDPKGCAPGLDKALIAATVLSGILCLSWGSWASLLWTQRRVLKILMLIVVMVPGLVMVAGGLWAFVTMPENRFIWRWGWLLVAGHGAGAMALGLYLGGRGSMKRIADRAERSRKMALGWTLFPIVASALLALLVIAGVMWWPESTGAVQHQAMVEQWGRWVLPSQLLVMVTTGVPAVAYWVCDALSHER